MLRPVKLVCIALWIAASLCPSYSAAQPADEASERAREHFERGLSRYNEEQYEAALAEFQAAYDAAPAPAVLYNLARVHAQLGHATQSMTMYERYVAEEAQMSRSRRREVEGAMADLRERIGFVQVESNVDGATISINGVDVATTPLSEPLRVDVGRIEVGARAPGYSDVNIEQLVASEQTATVRLELVLVNEDRGVLDIHSIPGVEIRLDGRLLGITPLPESRISTTAGPHTVEGRRTGYQTARVDINLATGATRPVDLEMEIDPRAPESVFGAVEVDVSSEFARYVLNGQQVDRETLGRLPLGPHTLEISVPGREPAAHEIIVRPGERTELRLTLRITDDRIGQLEEQSSTFTIVGWVLVGVGAALIVPGIISAVLQANALPDDHEARGAMVQRCSTLAPPIECNTDGYDVVADEQRFNDDVDRHNLFTTFTWLSFGTAIALIGTGAIFHLFAPKVGVDETEVSLAPSFNGMQLFGRF